MGRRALLSDDRSSESGPQSAPELLAGSSGPQSAPELLGGVVGTAVGSGASGGVVGAVVGAGVALAQADSTIERIISTASMADQVLLFIWVLFLLPINIATKLVGLFIYCSHARYLRFSHNLLFNLLLGTSPLMISALVTSLDYEFYPFKPVVAMPSVK